jgi:transcriptional regulator with XRE-family HTH domain
MVTQGSQAAVAALAREGRTLHGANVRRLMARLDLTQADVVTATGLDERTVRSLMRGGSQPHARTLHKFAAGLGVEVDELFHDVLFQDGLDGAAAFDRATNPAVAEAIKQHPKLFERWSAADFEELFSRVAVGGELTEAGALAAAEAMNGRRKLMQQVALILESGEADILREFVAMLYRRVTTL